MNIRYQNLQSISLEQARKCLNKAFEDYSVPIRLSRDMFRAKVYSEHIDLRCSGVALDEGKPVGLMLHGMTTVEGCLTAWNGGTGVIKSHRGCGIARSLYDFLLPRLRKQGIKKIALEVIHDNEAAIGLYKKLGFQIKRNLNSYYAADSSQYKPIVKHPDYTYKPLHSVIDQYALINDEQEHRDASLNPAGQNAQNSSVESAPSGNTESTLLDWRTYNPTWQNADHKLCKIWEELEVTALYNLNVLKAWAISERSTPGQVYQFGIAPNDKQSVYVIHLLHHLANRSDGKLSMLNVDANDEVSREVFNALQLNAYVCQLDMQLEM